MCGRPLNVYYRLRRMERVPELRRADARESRPRYDSKDDRGRPAEFSPGRRKSSGNALARRFLSVRSRERQDVAVDVDDDRLRRVLGM
ncbi:TPA: hypothetical protein QDB15_003514 [Burkholderia vietnamiensis]|uniref:Uncharacterized protein n=1 Tax=Burkholderia vietnamiensis TaxID=60552 RepID=A0AA44Y111_BURVI|nr:hypothetical protein [Burkholderia vietnamiensis]PRH42261.1 hypothetical protein C6T65_11155 [Burkholderia vietnamiensis]HDR9050680.1 hypothetical protein [Burkholderia vietnamiensis]HDR9119705.1 hypothetical protein [Burkholderia vietnamiensis]HDR9240072.1 hypothetical protein [Burkholderia vietnamiensis]